jgi:hypothetical protein
MVYEYVHLKFLQIDMHLKFLHTLYFIFILVAQKKTRNRRKSLGFTTPTFTGSDCERNVKHGPRQFPPEVQINADSTLLELQGQEN